MREREYKAARLSGRVGHFLKKMSSRVSKRIKNIGKYLTTMKNEFNGVVGIVFTREKPLLFALIYNKKTENITFPGGARENNESSNKKTLARELLEETGLKESEYKAKITPIIHEFTYGPRKKERLGIKAMRHIYLVKTSKKELIPKDSDARFHGWHTREEVLKLLTFDDSKEIFKKAIKLI